MALPPLTPPIFLPAPPDKYDKAWMARLLDSVKQQIGYSLSARSANDAIFMRSPGGKTYSVTVSDAGALVVTYVSG
jgi:hypothetical protein